MVDATIIRAHQCTAGGKGSRAQRTQPFAWRLLDQDQRMHQRTSSCPGKSTTSQSCRRRCRKWMAILSCAFTRSMIRPDTLSRLPGSVITPPSIFRPVGEPVRARGMPEAVPVVDMRASEHQADYVLGGVESISPAPLFRARQTICASASRCCLNTGPALPTLWPCWPIESHVYAPDKKLGAQWHASYAEECRGSPGGRPR